MIIITGFFKHKINNLEETCNSIQNTLIPLAGIRLDSDLKIVDIIPMTPCRTENCPSYKPRSEAQYVLEINQWLISEKGLLHTGDKCKL